jgi:hypothetical protein
MTITATRDKLPSFVASERSDDKAPAQRTQAAECEALLRGAILIVAASRARFGTEADKRPGRAMSRTSDAPIELVASNEPYDGVVSGRRDPTGQSRDRSLREHVSVGES